MTRMRSRERKAEWPSFMWQTVGRKPTARSARHAADAKKEFLPDAHVLVAAVEAGGDFAVFGAVLRRRWRRAGKAGCGRPGRARLGVDVLDRGIAR